MRNPKFTPAKATFHASSLTEGAVVESLRDFGCALIQRLFDPRDLAMFDARIERNSIGADEALRAGGAPENFNVGFPLYFGGADSSQLIHSRLRNTYPNIFDPALMVGMDCESVPKYVFNVLRKTGLSEIFRRYLGLERLCTSAAICHIRKFDFPVGEDLHEAEKGLEFHQDNRLYDLEPEMLTLWFPFRYEHGKMASLEFLPVSKKILLPTITRCGIDRDSIPQEMFWSPAYEIGDAVLISGYSPHRTYYPRNGNKARTSIDVRFFSTPVPEPIFEPLGALKSAEFIARRVYRRVATRLRSYISR